MLGSYTTEPKMARNPKLTDNHKDCHVCTVWLQHHWIFLSRGKPDLLTKCLANVTIYLHVLSFVCMCGRWALAHEIQSLISQISVMSTWQVCRSCTLSSLCCSSSRSSASGTTHRVGSVSSTRKPTWASRLGEEGEVGDNATGTDFKRLGSCLHTV